MRVSVSFGGPFLFPLAVGYGPIFARAGASADACSGVPALSADVRLGTSAGAPASPSDVRLVAPALPAGVRLGASAGARLGAPALLVYFDSGFAVFWASLL